MDDAERGELEARLERLDRASRHGPWTRTVLELIAARPEVRAPDLAAGLGLETQAFKRDVRKLKELGLTESLEVGYRLSRARPRAHERAKRSTTVAMSSCVGSSASAGLITSTSIGPS